ncbi:MAG: O-antigen ligase family protein [Parcubacteria group bacterium]|jgi:hypothetical protein
MFEFLNKPKTYLLLGNVLLVFFLILLNNLKILPLAFGDFLFFAFLALAVALYRPGWCFLLFVGMIPLENINLAPAELGIAIRPYQFIGAIIILALLIRLATKRLSFKLIKPEWYDWLVLIFVASGFLSIIGAPDKIASFKLSIIIATFVALYYLVRNYIQNSEDLKRVIPFFVSSSVIVVFYGIWQNWRFLHSLSNFEAMPGRPNATFTEADWLGMFLVLLISAIFILIRHSERNEAFGRMQSKNLPNNITSYNQEQIPRLRSDKILTSLGMTGYYIFLILTFILLALTVSRSAWLAALVVYVVFVTVFFTDLRLKDWKWRETSWLKFKIIASLAVAIAIVYIFHLTNFQLFNRVQSTGTGQQKITVSCEENKELPEYIDVVGELEEFSCRHINLEEIESEKAVGHFVKEVFRKDPNVSTRNEIYKKSWVEIKKHPILGIGWGNINQILGKDGRGTPLNSSNIFLETWLGAGMFGLLSLVILLGYILLKSVKNYYQAQNDVQKVVNLFILISWLGLVTTNLFNAGIFLGILWVWLAIAQIKE